MAVGRIDPPIDYLHLASRTSLQSFELARLNHAANLRREIAVLIDQWIEETAEAMLARWMLEHYGSLREPSLSAAEFRRALQEPGANPLPDIPQQPCEVSPAPPRLMAPGDQMAKAAATRLGK